MAITSIDGIVAGVQAPRFFSKGSTPTVLAGRWTSSWSMAGIPGAGAYDTTLNGVALSSTSANINGQIPHSDPGSGSAYLHRCQLFVNNQSQYLLCDRLWHNGGINPVLITSQSITSPTWPARDQTGNTNGLGVFLALEISAQMGGTAPTVTIGYTNSDGTSGRTGTNIWTVITDVQPPYVFPISVQGGDKGVRSVQSLTLSVSWLSGTCNLVAYRVLAAFNTPAASSLSTVNALTGGLPILYNGVVPYFMSQGVTTIGTVIAGSYQEVHG